MEAPIVIAVIGLFLLFCGTYMFLIHAYENYYYGKLAATGVKTLGRATHLALDLQDNNMRKDKVVARFTAADGKEYEASAWRSCANAQDFVGKEVSIVYDPKNPRNNRLEFDIAHTKRVEFIGDAFMIISGLILFLVGYVWARMAG